ncbi:MAG: outer membrane protein transport protein [Muribaculaceae bacterium]|nr:outer membrane protein transport protein [Muribaculaceae bacterium]MDE6541229.1 outer membrane protein transport protein [Muribaculaceae bacterium]
MKKIVSTVLAATVALAAAAEGYQVNTLSTKQLGMGHTGVGLKLGAESMLFNPAGMAFSEHTLDVTASVSAVAPKATATLTDGSQWSTHAPVSTPVNAAAAFRIIPGLQAGVAFYTPYGSGIEWLDNWPGAVLNQRCTLRAFTVQPTVSWRIIPGLSIGAGLMVTWGDVNLDKGLVSASSMDAMLGVLDATGGSAVLGLPTGYRYGTITPASVNLDGTTNVAFGYNIGAMYDITPRLTVGVNFRSKMNLTVDAGIASVRYADDVAQGLLQPALGIINQANFRATMPAPYVLSFGVGYKPTDRWTVALDAQLTGWSAYRSLDVEFLDSKLTAFDQHITKDYRNAWAVKAGVQYAATKRLDLRLGLMVDTTPVRDTNYNPETPGTTKIDPSVGFSFRPVKGLSVDFALMYVAGLNANDRTCTYSDLLAASRPELGLPAERTFEASYRIRAWTPSLGVSYAF